MLPALFPAITMIAHALEDYIETASKVGLDHLPAIQAYTDAIRVIADHGENPGDSETTEILRALPHSGTVTVNATPTDQITRDIGFLLVLPKGLQRRIIGEGLASCGFRSASPKPPSRPSKSGSPTRPISSAPAWSTRT